MITTLPSGTGYSTSDFEDKNFQVTNCFKCNTISINSYNQAPANAGQQAVV